MAQNGPDSNPRWSPDGTRIAFVSSMGKPFFYYQNSVIATVQPGSATVASLTDAFDEDPNLVAWTKAGIFFWPRSARGRTCSRSIPATRQITRHAVARRVDRQRLLADPRRPQRRVHRLRAGRVSRMSTSAALGDDGRAHASVTDTGAQIAAWPKHAREVVRWKSQDGAEIEGVLHKPADFQAGRRYPLLVVIHGGPTGVSRPVPYSSVGYYPIDPFLAKGALVLEPNYRGSAGYGEKFRSLNVRNLGIGDAWDVLSGIDHLVAAGPGRSRSRRRDGVEPGRLHLGVPHHAGTRIASRRSRSAPASRTG